ncbi:hypothetical protein CFP65_2847 [Kitasatospora sp. MMS16-BH015]|uniref:hypothetical protein n=1 Tax=Kitasatospora sp. MMS16-BH015 TaxID=2018025 RepID=UPI000CA2B8D2|nr:hypothetical protein [Kitasatospora sp. MMS16-BH015]AUG77663.1 hypothetical protein CFP65_2847 [Kitasatospora sp. MMS16-BH015]
MPDVAIEAPELPEAPGVLPADPPPAPAGPPRPARGHRLLAGAAEAAVGLAVGIGFMLWARNIHVNPMIRIGQVSGLAKLQFRAALLAVPLFAVVLYAAHRAGPQRYRLLLRLGCAAVAGLGTGIVAGGIAVALHGTPWGLGGQDGDPGTLEGYAASYLRGEGLPGIYPPGFIWLLAEWAKHVRHGHVGFALKDMQLLLSAVVGPCAYLAWRLLLRPAWALAVALPAALLFLDPIRPYSHLVMLCLVPVLGRLLTELTRTPGLRLRSALLRGAGLGALLGLLFLTYSGWFVWSAPGTAVAVLALTPWRKGRAALGRAAALLGAAGLCFAAVGAPLLLKFLANGANTVDRYAYFDTYIDPAYVMGWRSDRSGWPPSWAWPPPGELAGQTTFTLLVVAGFALALALGLRRPAVVAVLGCLGGSWVLRFWFAGHMQRDQAVMLYPRTTWLILYCFIALTVLAAMIVSGGAARSWRRLTASRKLRPSGSLGRRLAAGSLCGLAVFGAMGASWSANRYMPVLDPDSHTMGLDAYRAHTLAKADGSCPVYAPKHTCTPPHYDWRPKDSVDTSLWCGNVAYASWTAFCGGKPPNGVVP